MNENINNIINSFGAIAELTKIEYDAFINAGFDSYQALYLCCEILKSSLKDKMDPED